MARGKIQIRKIESATNRQVTFSKRRNGLVKKAEELSVLCDAKVSVIILSGTGKLHEYTSQSTSTKELIDLYQSTSGTDLWSSQYEKMQEQLKMMREENRNLRMQISQRMGKCLDGMDYNELDELEQEMEEAAKTIRERMYKVMTNKINTTSKKGSIKDQFKRQMESWQIQSSIFIFMLNQAIHRINNDFLTEDIRDDPDYALVEGSGGHYDSSAGYTNRFPNILALGLQLNQPNLQTKAESIFTP